METMEELKRRSPEVPAPTLSPPTARPTTECPPPASAFRSTVEDLDLVDLEELLVEAQSPLQRREELPLLRLDRRPPHRSIEVTAATAAVREVRRTIRVVDRLILRLPLRFANNQRAEASVEPRLEFEVLRAEVIDCTATRSPYRRTRRRR